LVATSNGGVAILDRSVGVSAAIASLSVGNASASNITTVSTDAANPQNGATQAALLMGNSGSMDSNDPNRFRAAETKLCWEAVLPVRATNRAAFLDFGTVPGAASPAHGCWCRLLQVLRA
jgi:hypothetical protein